MNKLLFALILAGFALPSYSSVITQQFDLTFQTASGLYSAGEFIRLTTTYQDDGTVLHIWNDGPNQTADFGAHDDTPALFGGTQHVNDSPGTFDFMSDMTTFTVTGLAELPTGDTPRDGTPLNSAFIYGLMGGGLGLQIESDTWVVWAHLMPTYSDFGVYQYVVGLNGASEYDSLQREEKGIGSSKIVQVKNVVNVPEPLTMALVCLGLTGIMWLHKAEKK